MALEPPLVLMQAPNAGLPSDSPSAQATHGVIHGVGCKPLRKATVSGDLEGLEPSGWRAGVVVHVMGRSVSSAIWLSPKGDEAGL